MRNVSARRFMTVASVLALACTGVTACSDSGDSSSGELSVAPPKCREKKGKERYGGRATIKLTTLNLVDLDDEEVWKVDGHYDTADSRKSLKKMELEYDCKHELRLRPGTVAVKGELRSGITSRIEEIPEYDECKRTAVTPSGEPLPGQDLESGIHPTTYPEARAGQLAYCLYDELDGDVFWIRILESDPDEVAKAKDPKLVPVKIKYAKLEK